MQSFLNLNNGKPKGFVVASEGLSLETLSVLAFDIDKFKQVNDTYGHIYGDQVLKSFAWRLEHIAEILKDEFGSSIRISLGHPSGEEFLALIEGSISNEDLTQIAERFRQCIADESLPSDNEWNRLAAATELEKVRLPPKGQRSISTSVGIASYLGSTSSANSAPLVLLDKADIALYKSKSGGRNRVTQFEDILQQCGRVLEHDLSTGVVAVDIGSKVNVLSGQEFRVYPPIYCGNTAFTVDDGRSRRTLGIYPKIELCRIVIFNSQSDISFGTVSNQTTAGTIIPVGAILEAVPLGSITHLIERQHSFSSENFEAKREPQTVSGGRELQEFVEQLIKNGDRPFAAVFRFKYESDFHNKYGSAAVNRALAQLFSLLRTKYVQAALVGLIDTTAICVVGKAEIFDIDELSTLLADSYPQRDELEPLCGFYRYSISTDDFLDPVQSPEFDRHAIELARYALSYIDGFSDKRMQAFSITIAENILAQHRKIRTYSAGVADYRRFQEIGVRSANIENNGGLCYSALKENSLSLECYQRAMELNPENIMYIGNAGMLANRTKQTDLGLKIFSKIPENKLAHLKKVHPGALWNYSVLLAYGAHSNSPLYDIDRMRIIGPAACELDNATNNSDYSLVKSIVDNLPKVESVADNE